jgi:hypothetical protein
MRGEMGLLLRGLARLGVRLGGQLCLYDPRLHLFEDEALLPGLVGGVLFRTLAEAAAKKRPQDRRQPRDLRFRCRSALPRSIASCPMLASSRSRSCAISLSPRRHLLLPSDAGNEDARRLILKLLLPVNRGLLPQGLSLRLPNKRAALHLSPGLEIVIHFKPLSASAFVYSPFVLVIVQIIAFDRDREKFDGRAVRRWV